MKKLFSILFVCIYVQDLNAQEKPSKESTITFLNKELQKNIGLSNDGLRTTEVSLTYTSYSQTMQVVDSDTEITLQYLSINWEEVSKVVATDLDNEFSDIEVFFKNGITKTRTGLSSRKDINLESSFILTIPTNKIGSCQKAILRLSEIAKEENKDPFKE